VSRASIHEVCRRQGIEKATTKQTVEQALRLPVRLRRQQQVGAAYGEHRWR
jgi:hypothetical protein